MKAGVVEFLTKPFGAEEVLEAIQRGSAKHRSARQQRARTSDLKHRYHALTRREAEVFLLVTRGLLNKQVAAALGTSEKTIKVIAARSCKK